MLQHFRNFHTQQSGHELTNNERDGLGKRKDLTLIFHPGRLLRPRRPAGSAQLRAPHAPPPRPGAHRPRRRDRQARPGREDPCPRPRHRGADPGPRRLTATLELRELRRLLAHRVDYRPRMRDGRARLLGRKGFTRRELGLEPFNSHTVPVPRAHEPNTSARMHSSMRRLECLVLHQFGCISHIRTQDQDRFQSPTLPYQKTPERA